MPEPAPPQWVVEIQTPRKRHVYVVPGRGRDTAEHRALTWAAEDGIGTPAQLAVAASWPDDPAPTHPSDEQEPTR